MEGRFATRMRSAVAMQKRLDLGRHCSAVLLGVILVFMVVECCICEVMDGGLVEVVSKIMGMKRAAISSLENHDTSTTKE